MRNTSCTFAIIAVGICTAGISRADDLIYGCWNRPTCGKYCKLVCETTKITVVGYGSKCDTICVPGPSCMGCKHCSVECCPADSCGPCGTMDGDVCCEPCCKKDCCCEGAPAKLEFCWRDWFAAVVRSREPSSCSPSIRRRKRFAGITGKLSTPAPRPKRMQKKLPPLPALLDYCSTRLFTKLRQLTLNRARRCRFLTKSTQRWRRTYPRSFAAKRSNSPAQTKSLKTAVDQPPLGHNRKSRQPQSRQNRRRSSSALSSSLTDKPTPNYRLCTCSSKLLM